MAVRGSTPAPPSQEIRCCRAPDGVRIAYAVHGSGPPLVISTCWLSHLQFDWESPVWRHFLDDIGEFATVIRFDERGHGLSDWDVADHSLEARVGDLEAVVDAAGLDRFALMAMAQGGPVSITYAVRHPERVTRLLFYGSYAAAMRDPTPEDLELSDAFEQMIKVGWARPDSVFRRVAASGGVATARASLTFFTHFPNVISWTPIFLATSAIERFPSMMKLTTSSLYSSVKLRRVDPIS